ncbi:MAG: hypothetical protein AAGE94_17500 [Acidobacteriota bacterium]
MPTIDRLSLLGAGKMGAALLTAMLDAEIVDPSDVVATALHTSRLDVVRDGWTVCHGPARGRLGGGGLQIVPMFGD